MKYYFNKDNFVMENYNQLPAFSSFLPGISGLKGIPLWCFYVNRGQGIASFGVQDKNKAIIEFSPANISYQKVLTQGFRTFIKVNNEVYEPFKNTSTNNKMIVDEGSFQLEEINEKLGIKIKVKYFGLPNAKFAALVRRVEIENISDNKNLNIEVLDGSSIILPIGVDNGSYKNVGNLMRSWMEVFNLENKIGFYRLRASSKDQAEVEMAVEGNFYLSLVNGKLTAPLSDNDLIFDYDLSLIEPIGFKNHSLEEIKKSKVITENKVPCAFTPVIKELKSKEKINIDTLIGNVECVELINEISKNIDVNYFNQKEKEAILEISKLTDDIWTKTKYEIFDKYAKQCYIDNFIRGGYPILLGDQVYHVYSRKHGDLERDYNWFMISPEYYTNGNGNFRDTNQNRRNDSLFKNYVKDYNIKTFMNLIQLDGYNPLSINGVTFELKNKEEDLKEIKKLVNDEKFLNILTNKFTPGQIMFYLDYNSIETKLSYDEILESIIKKSKQNIEANFGEGYWIDHWTYNYDLIKNYLLIYPDKEEDLLFNDNSYMYYNSPIYVLPRSEKYVLDKNGNVRQYGMIRHHSKEILDLQKRNEYQTYFLETKEHKRYETTLIEKLISLATIKFSLLDPYGMGIEMEGEKPGWNDAMNGLPGLFGSGVSETLELKRVVDFIRNIIEKYQDKEVLIMGELNEFVNKIESILKEEIKDDFVYWDKVAFERENYREKTNVFVSGNKTKVKLKDLEFYFDAINKKIEKGLNKALEIGNGIYPTYFTYEATKFELVKNEKNEMIISHYGLPKVKVQEFKANMVPYFLEAPARALKVMEKQEAKLMYEKIKNTEMYDELLHIYKTSVSLEDETFEIGRIRAFTKGWLERESCFLHMIYKYLYGLLQSGLYEEFFEEIKDNLVCFMNPEVYGRSTLENSSFIATSNNPDPKTHGRGFVSRLTGANTEFLSIWQTMMFGKKPFKMVNNELICEFKPILPKDFFDDQNEVSAKFLSNTIVTYHNESRKDTFDKSITIEKVIIDDMEIQEPYLNQNWATKLREGSLRKIKIFFN